LVVAAPPVHVVVADAFPAEVSARRKIAEAAVPNDFVFIRFGDLRFMRGLF
jgi:hypothetical protein